jgi:hypothetical protein
MLFVQRPNSVPAYSKILIKLSSILQSNTEDCSTPWAATSAISLSLGHNNGRPLIWHNFINKVKITSFTYKNICTFFKFLLHPLLFSLFYISVYSGYYMPLLILLLYFSLCWRKTFSAIKTTGSNRTCNWQTLDFILRLYTSFNANIKLEWLLSHSQ